MDKQDQTQNLFFYIGISGLTLIGLGLMFALILVALADYVVIGLIAGFLIMGGLYLLIQVGVLALAIQGKLSTGLTKKVRTHLLTYFGAMDSVFKGSNQKKKLRQALIRVNNTLVGYLIEPVDPKRLMVLTPHCLQVSTCKHKVAGQENNCKLCGACVIGDLTQLQRDLGFKLVIATGGTLARQAIADHRPAYIIAVACERDLMHGLIDAKHFVVLALKNDLPYGPCLNTCVDVHLLKQALENMMIKE